MPTLRSIVAEYRRVHRPRLQKAQRWHAGRRPLLKAVEFAALAQSLVGEKLEKVGKHPHQWRLRRRTLNSSCRELIQSIPELRRCTSFKELHDTIRDATSGIKGAGELYVYDTALRIGAKLRLSPRQVYLHAGARKGARGLGVGLLSKRVSRNKFPPEFRGLTSHEIENLLCIYESPLVAGTGPRRTGVTERLSHKG